MVKKSYIRNCIIVERDGDGTLFDITNGKIYLDGYAIIPIEEYNALKVKVDEEESTTDKLARAYKGLGYISSKGTNLGRIEEITWIG